MRIFKDQKGPYFGDVIQYFTKEEIEKANIREDIKKDALEYLHKTCTAGVIVGFEQNESFLDYYYIVLTPEDKIRYVLANSHITILE